MSAADGRRSSRSGVGGGEAARGVPAAVDGHEVGGRSDVEGVEGGTGRVSEVDHVELYVVVVTGDGREVTLHGSDVTFNWEN